jgi:hypothetical protein
MLRSVLITLAIAFSASANAQKVDYSYVQGSYGRVDFDALGRSLEGDGPGISASFAIGESFHIYGEYQTADLGLSVNFNLTELGAGYHTDITHSLYVYANVGHVAIGADAGGGTFSANDDGVSVGIGLRAAVSETVELFGGLDYVDLDDPYSETRVNAGFELGVTENIGVGLKAIFWDNLNIFQISARLYFK